MSDHTDTEAIARIIEAEIDHDIKGNIAWANGKRAATAILSYLASRREAQEPVAPSDCVDRMNCGLRRIATEPDIGLTACSRPNCPHTTQALSAPPSPAPAGEVERLRAELAEARAALGPFASVSEGVDNDEHGVWWRHDGDVLYVEDFIRARAAFNGGWGNG